MVARGHGIDALCVYLAIARTALLDLVVALGLATPHDRARRPGGRNAWSAEDIPVFIALWMAGWQAASLAQRFDRKPTAIWAKARHLGLPRRDRKILFRPVDPLCLVQVPICPAPEGQLGLAVRAMVATAATPSMPKPPGRALISAGQVLAAGQILKIETGRAFVPQVVQSPTTRRLQTKLADVLNSGAHEAGSRGFAAAIKVDTQLTAHASKAALTAQPVGRSLFQSPPLPMISRATASILKMPRILRKGERLEIVWTTALDDEVSNRHWAFQNYRGCARDMEISVGAIRTRKTRLQLPQLPRGEQLEEYNPDWAAPTIAAYGYAKKRCKAFWEHCGIEFYFWSRITDRGVRDSQLAKSKRWYHDRAF